MSIYTLLHIYLFFTVLMIEPNVSHSQANAVPLGHRYILKHKIWCFLEANSLGLSLTWSYWNYNILFREKTIF